MRKTIKTEAIVLMKRSLLGKDLIVTLFTKELGKARVLAKGVKKITSRRLPHIQTGNLIKAVINKRGEYLYLQQTDLISAFSNIKKDEKKIGFLYSLFFILDRVLPEEQKEVIAYNLTKKILIDISKNNITQVNMTAYINQLISIFGYSKKNMVFDEQKLFLEELIHEKLPNFVI